MTCSHKHSCGCGSLSNANIKAVIEGLLTTALDEKDFDALELKNSIYQNLLRIGDVQDKLNDFKADMAVNLSALLTKTELASIKAELENLITSQQNIYEDLQIDFEAATSQQLLVYKSDVLDIQQDVSDQLNAVQNQMAALVPTRDAYKIAVQNGFVGSEASWLDSLKGHSAFTIAKAHGFRGSEAEWLSSLKGDTGPQGLRGPQGTPGIDGRDGVDGADGKDGADGISAYEVARNYGYVGSESAWLNSLIGEKGDRGVGVAHVNHNSDDTLTFLFTDNTSYTTNSLKGDQGIQGPGAKSVYDIAVSHGFTGNEEDWLNYILENSETVSDLFADADSLEQFINGSEDETVLTRLSAEYPTLQKAIKELFENGGLPATPFTTKALMESGALVDGDYAMVTEDSDNNGLYVKTAGSWVKSSYDPVVLANVYTDIMARKLREENAGIVNPEWERGSLDAGGVKYISDSLSRLRFKERTLAPNTRVTVTSSDPDIEVAIVTWDKDNNFNYFAFTYAQEITRTVPHEYSVLARYKDLRDIEDIDEITSKIKISHVSQNDMKVVLFEDKLETLKNNLSSLEHSVFGWGGELELVNGTLANATGEIWHNAESKARRLTSPTHKIKYNGTLTLQLTTEGQKLKVYLYDEAGKLTKMGSWYSSGTEVTVQVDGYFNPMVAWEDDTQLITPADAELQVNYKGLTSIASEPTGDTSKLSEDIQTLKDLVFTGRYVPSWRIGSYSAGGSTNYNPNNRLRFATGKVPYKGELIVATTNPLQSVRVVTFKEDGSFIGYNSLAKKHEVQVDGYFDVLVKWDSDAPMQPEDAGVEITLVRGGSGSGSDPSVFDPSGMPRFSEVPFGHLIGKTLPELQTSFDNLVAEYHGTTTKTSIGFSTSGNHEMFVYELTPPDYEMTIAITMHTHGNERYNPLGFYALLNEMQRDGNKHEFIKWLKENVRWLVVPFASPTGVAKNVRSYDGTNPNRDYDHLWDLYEGADKGSKVFSINETRNIAEYFKPLRKEVDYHLDLHDIPGGDGGGYAYNPFGLPQTAYKKEQHAVKNYLGEMNDTVVGGDYVMAGGSATNYFSAVLAVPSITPEHVTQYWLKRGFTPDQQIAKALEQLSGFLYLFRYFHQQEDLRHSSYYTDKYEVAFSSKEFGIYSWSKAQIYDAILETGFLTEDVSQSNVFLNTEAVDAPTILVLSGSTEDDNNSDLTVLRVLQNIQGGDKMFINHLKNSNLVVAPALLANTPDLETVNDHVSALVAKYNPDYTVLVTAAGFEDAVGITTGSSNEESSFTSMTKKSGVTLTTEESDLSDSLSGRYTIFSLQNEVVRHAAYPHTVAKWVGLVANDLASYYSKIRNT